MAEAIPITRTTIPEGVDVTHVARVWKASGAVFAFSDFSSGNYDVQVYDDGGTVIYEQLAQSMTSGDPVFASLQTDGYWGGKDTPGYNFRHTLTQAELTSNAYEGGRIYRVVYTLHTNNDGDVPLIFEDTVAPVAL